MLAGGVKGSRVVSAGAPEDDAPSAGSMGGEGGGDGCCRTYCRCSGRVCEASSEDHRRKASGPAAEPTRLSALAEPGREAGRETGREVGAAGRSSAGLVERGGPSVAGEASASDGAPQCSQGSAAGGQQEGQQEGQQAPAPPALSTPAEPGREAGREAGAAGPSASDAGAPQSSQDSAAAVKPAAESRGLRTAAEPGRETGREVGAVGRSSAGLVERGGALVVGEVSASVASSEDAMRCIQGSAVAAAGAFARQDCRGKPELGREADTPPSAIHGSFSSAENCRGSLTSRHVLHKGPL